MGRRLWVCFYCRISVRRAVSTTDVRCARCKRACVYLGYKTRIPSPTKKDAWDELHAAYWLAAAERAEKEHRENIRTAHEIEKKIDVLKERPENRDRRRTIKTLSKRKKRLVE